MESIITVLIIAAAAAYLVWRFFSKKPPSASGCGCQSACPTCSCGHDTNHRNPNPSKHA